MTLRKSKYGNRKVTLDGLTFDSKLEADRWSALKLLNRAGQIANLRRQVRFELAPSVKYIGARSRKPALTCVADFVYEEHGVTVVEDAKGVLTEGFGIKRHLMFTVHGVDIRLTGRAA